MKVQKKILNNKNKYIINIKNNIILKTKMNYYNIIRKLIIKIE